MLDQLYAEVDRLLDRDAIEKEMLTLEQDLIKYEAAAKDMKYLENQLTFIDKLNPFGERDKKGEILKIQYEMDEIAELYNADMAAIRSKAASAIKSIDAFVAKFQMDWLIRSIKNISAYYHGGGNNKLNRSGIRISGKEDSIERAHNLDQTLEETYGEMYKNCPPYKQFIEGYMIYLTDPFNLPVELRKS